MPGYVTILRRHLALVALMGVVGLLLSAAVLAGRQPVYQATADVQLEQVESPFRSSGGTRGDLTRAMQTQIDIATGDAVRAEVLDTLGALPPVVVTAKGERDELQFTAVADTAERAAEVANAWAAGYVEVLRADADAEAERYFQSFDRLYSRVYAQIATLDERRATATGAELAQLNLQRDVLVTQLKALAGRRTPEGFASAAQILASPVRLAQVPEAPVSDSAPRLLTLGLLGGLVVGYLLACLKEARRDEVRTAEDVAVAAPGTTVLGPVGTGAHVTVLSDPALAAAYQSLRAEVSALSDTGRGASVLALTSAKGEPAVDEVAAGLAVSLARAGRRVVLVDAVRQSPRQHVLFETYVEPGLADVLDGGLPVGAALVPVPLSAGASLWLLPAGAAGHDEVLPPPAFHALVQSLVADPQFDTVVVSSPGVLGTPDALTVAEVASAVLLVATVRGSRRRTLRAALHRVALASPPVLAVVLARPQETTPGRWGRVRRLRRGRKGTEHPPVRPTTDRPETVTAGRRSEARTPDSAGRRR